MAQPKRWRWTFWLMPAVALLLIASTVKDDFFEMSKQLEIMQSAFRELNLSYVDELAPGEMMETGIHAMLAKLDPYTRYFPESKMEDVRFMQTGEYGGIGASVERTNDGTFVVVDLLDNEPAQQAGLRLGDELLQVDGQRIESLSQNRVGELMKGATGTTVTLEIQRPGNDGPLNYELERRKVKIPDIPYRGMLSDRVGYLALGSFTKTASAEVRKSVMFLKDSLQAEALVVDLRGNGGGLLREAIAMVNLFVGKNQEVVSTKGKTDQWNKSYKTRGNALIPDMPVVVLVDGRSASASEIVAGTLQDLDRAVVIGEESFGKGLVQKTVKLAYGTRMKVTVAKYYTPSGRCVQRLDYSHRDKDGEVHAAADSTLNTFYTANGRAVLEGRGVLPDVEVPLPEPSYVLLGLLDHRTLFDFVVANRDALDTPEDALDFRLTDEWWERFVTHVEGLDEVPYASETEQAFAELLITANTELLTEPNQETFDRLKADLKPEVRNDLERHAEEIRAALEAEMVAHRFGKQGTYRHGLASDPVTMEALEVLGSERYAAILSGPINP